MFQLHLSDRQFYCLMRCILYQMFYGSLCFIFCCRHGRGCLLWCWSWNITWENLVRIMTSDDLAPCVTRTSATMVLIVRINGTLSSMGRISTTCAFSLLRNDKENKNSLVSTINSAWYLGPSDAIWQQRSGSTLAQVMACCLTAPSHYLNQCWLLPS